MGGRIPLPFSVIRTSISDVIYPEQLKDLDRQQWLELIQRQIESIAWPMLIHLNMRMANRTSLCETVVEQARLKCLFLRWDGH
jgi:hypothetical protein